MNVSAVSDRNTVVSFPKAAPVVLDLLIMEGVTPQVKHLTPEVLLRFT